MKRRVIEIDRDKCNGCGICATACNMGAIGMVDGKAALLRENYCDGLGVCLPHCPTGAIAFVEKEAPAFDAKAAAADKNKKPPAAAPGPHPAPGPHGHPHPMGGCPGSAMRSLQRPAAPAESLPTAAPLAAGPMQSELQQWPVQIQLVPVNAPYLSGAKLLVAADCTAFAYGDFHRRFMRGRVTLIGCPKLDTVEYSEKLTAIIKENDIRSVEVIRMEVPCCGGIEQAVKTALQNSGKMIPWQVHTISVEGELLDV